MKKILVVIVILVCLSVLSGCMDILPKPGDHTSKINEFSIDKSNIMKGDTFNIHIDASIGSTMNISIQNAQTGGDPKTVYSIVKNGYDNETILVNYESQGLGYEISSPVSGWENTYVTPNSLYNVLLTVCDGPSVQGGQYCVSSDILKIRFK